MTGVIICDPDFRVLLSDGEFFSSVDTDREHLGTIRISELLPADLAELLDPSFERASRGLSTIVDANHGGKDYVLRTVPIVTGDAMSGVIVTCGLESNPRRLDHAAALDVIESSTDSIYATVFDHAPFGMTATDLDFHWLRVNEAFCRMLGYSRQEILGTTMADLTHPADQHLDDEWTRLLISGAATSVKQEKRLIAKDGSIVGARVKHEAFTDPDDHAILTVSLFEVLTGSQDQARLDRERTVWTDRISRAISEDRLVLLCQPIMDLATGGTDRVELLVRMRKEDEPAVLIPPGDFLPAAERFDLIADVDRWVVERGLEIAMHQSVEINLSVKTISDPLQIREIKRLISESGAPPENITFEITETAVARDLESAGYFADSLRASGCSFALDDFGVGFGAFSYLKSLPVDFLKIDIDFVRDLKISRSDRQVVSAIVASAKLLGARTIAEGVEDAETLDQLKKLKVDFAQGYWIGRPGPCRDWRNDDKERGSIDA